MPDGWRFLLAGTRGDLRAVVDLGVSEMLRRVEDEPGRLIGGVCRSAGLAVETARTRGTGSVGIVSLDDPGFEVIDLRLATEATEETDGRR